MADNKVDVEPTSRVAARRKAREQAAVDEAKGAVGGAGTSSSKGKAKPKGGRFANRNTREKRRGTGIVTLQDDDIDQANEDVKQTTAYNEDIGRQPIREADHCGNGCSNGAVKECNNGAADVCSNGTTETQQSPRHRRRDIANSDETQSHHNARRRLPEDASSSLETTPISSIQKRAEARESTDGRSPEEWRRMYEREHRENRRMQRKLADAEKTIASLEDELYLITQELEVAEDDLDLTKEENRILNKALDNRDS